jgi:plasmid stability protein
MKETYDFSAAKRGPVAPSKGKTRITIMLDDAVIQAARERADQHGVGYQTLINSVLKEALCTGETTPAEHKLDEIAQAIEVLSKQQQTLLATFKSAFERKGSFVAEAPPDYGVPTAEKT